MGKTTKTNQTKINKLFAKFSPTCGGGGWGGGHPSGNELSRAKPCTNQPAFKSSTSLQLSNCKSSTTSERSERTQTTKQNETQRNTTQRKATQRNAERRSIAGRATTNHRFTTTTPQSHSHSVSHSVCCPSHTLTSPKKILFTGYVTFRPDVVEHTFEMRTGQLVQSRRSRSPDERRRSPT